MHRRTISVLAAILLTGALLAPGAAGADEPQRFRLTAATGGTGGQGGGRLAGYGSLPIHTDAYQKAKAAANERAAAQARSHAGPPSALHAGPTTASGGDGQSQPGITPPDPTGAIGPTRYIELINLRYGIYDRSGVQISSGTLANLTNVTTDNLSDPQILWDPETRHLYYLVLDFTTNTFAVGWSKDDSPNGSADFCKYVASFGYGSYYLPDYPKLGTSKDFLLIGSNVFLLQSFYVGSDVDWIDKPAAGPLTTCPTGSGFHVGTFSALKNTDGSSATTPVPAVQTDPDGAGRVAATPDVASTGNANYLSLFKVTGTRATGASISAPSTVPVPSYGVPASALQLGGPTIDTLDGRLERAVSGVDPARGNKMAVWTAHAVYGGAGSEERWYEIDPNTATVLQSGKATSSTLSVWNGAVSPDRAVNNGSAQFGQNMVMGFNTSSSSTYPAVQMVSKAGTNAQSAFTMVQQSPGPNVDFSCSSPYGPPCRWGDYSGASADPTPDLSCATGAVWLSGEWNLASADDSGTDWRTWNWQASPSPCTVAPTAPGAAILSAKALRGGDVRLTWTVPSDGGSAITKYKVYRGTEAGGEVFLADVVGATSYRDTSTLRRTPYWYYVKAVNVVGAGPPSNEVKIRTR